MAAGLYQLLPGWNLIPTVPTGGVFVELPRKVTLGLDDQFMQCWFNLNIKGKPARQVGIGFCLRMHSGEVVIGLPSTVERYNMESIKRSLDSLC